MKTIVQIDDNYKNWLEELSDRFRSSQIKPLFVSITRCCAFTGHLAEIFLRWSFRQNTDPAFTRN